MPQNDTIYCPKCGSSNIYASKKGFSATQALAGKIITGSSLGALVSGSIGKDKIKLTCLKCGHTFNIGEGSLTPFVNDERVKPISAKDMSPVHMYKCECGKISSLPTDRAVCPRCGRRLTSDNYYSDKNIDKGGCMGVLIIPILLIAASIFIIFS